MVLTLDHGHEAEQEGQAEEEVQLHDQDPANKFSYIVRVRLTALLILYSDPSNQNIDS